jgi:hypothetical protein
MNQSLLWPYDEVSVRFTPGEAKVAVEAPWLSASREVTAETAPATAELAEKLRQGELVPSDISLVNWFFQPLDEYPFCYTLPTRKAEEGLDHPKRVESPAAIDSLSGFFEARFPGASLDIKRREWGWDWEAASSFARAGEGIHPESLFSVARRFHLLDLLELCDSRDVFQQAAALAPAEFKRVGAILVRQNHYVTQRCAEALRPALEIAGQARPLVERFIKDETGHDRILQRAVSEMSESPESLPVAPETRALMHLLRFAAETNFLAFAMAIDFFERSSYEETDPLARLLAEGGCAAAAKQIGIHSAINDAGHHENVARRFLTYLAPCDPEYAREALRLAEAISLLIIAVPRAGLREAILV